jgi:hypothetical protein
MKPVRGRENLSSLKKTVYCVVVLFLALGVIKGYLLWLDNYFGLHPEVVYATAAGYVEELPLEGVLIWDEEVVTAPADGLVIYPSSEPKRVMKGEIMAVVGETEVRARVAGYFIPGLDGQEGKWVYSRLWPGILDFPRFVPAAPLGSGARLRQGEPLGKLVPQPQELRCIAYLDKTAALEQDILSGFVNIRTEPGGRTRRAGVRACLDADRKVKVYLTLPFFLPSALVSRGFSCSVLAGEQRGVSVPDSAVLLRGGKLGVLMVRGGITEFVEVEGFPADEDSFFITRSVDAGSMVVLHADKVKEGVIRLW